MYNTVCLQHHPSSEIGFTKVTSDLFIKTPWALFSLPMLDLAVGSVMSPSFLKLLPGSNSLCDSLYPGFPWITQATPFQHLSWTPLVRCWSFFSVYTVSWGNLTIAIVPTTTYVLKTPKYIFSTSTYISGSELCISNYWIFPSECPALSDTDWNPSHTCPSFLSSWHNPMLPTSRACVNPPLLSHTANSSSGLVISSL